MLKNNNVKIIISLIAVCLVILTARICFAADDSYLDKLNQLPTENAVDIEEGNKVENNVDNQNTNNNVTDNNVNTNKNENVPTETPYAGLGDNMSIVFIAIFILSSVYAYKKVKDYNI